jgi:ADP-ribose pyrophosphatase YjhB (NUDIX family)
VTLRVGIRALVVDGAARVALVRFDFPDRTVWAAPGGGVERVKTTRRHSHASSARRSGSS